MEGTSTVEPEGATADDIRPVGEDPGLAAARSIAKDVPEPDKDGSLGPDDTRVVVDAADWLLKAFDEREEEVVRPIELNVGTSRDPVWMPWVLKPVPGPDLRRIRARAADQLIERRGSKSGDTLTATNMAARANAEIVLAGTKTPNLVAVAQRRDLADPTILVEEAFKKKPGLVDLVSAAIMELSGYDEDAMRDSMEIAAAGNSHG